jgi:predicted NBD/HSP70 family sugar kinase
MNNIQQTSVIRQISLRSVVEAVLEGGPISRAELARVTGLSKQTTSEVVRALEASGWLRVEGRTQGSVGRSATTYEIDPNGALVMGVDLGGTKTHVVLANLLGTILSEVVEPTDQRGGQTVIEHIGTLAEHVATKAGTTLGAVRGGVMGSPGVLEPRSGIITAAPNIPGFDQFNVAQALRDRLGFDVGIENDVNIAAQGEMWQGSCRDARTFAFVALGTGIGMGLVSDGQLIRGASGAAGEIAYLPVGGDPFDSRGYRYGTLESSIGSEAVVERYRGLGGSADNVRSIFDRLEAGDAIAETVIDDVARILVQALMAVRAILDPELVVLGGSIGARPELVARTRDFARRYMPEQLRIEPSALGSRAAIVGAVGMALTRLHDGLFRLASTQGRYKLPPTSMSSPNMQSAVY